MTVTSKRETIIEYIRETIIPKINGEGNYNLSVTNITRRFRPFDEYQNYPAVFISDDLPVDYTPLTNTEYTTGKDTQNIQEGMQVLINGYVQLDETDSGDTGKLSTELNKIYSDLIIAMFSDLTFGDNVCSVALISTKNSIDWIGQRIGYVTQIYSIKYDFEPTAATPIT